MFDKIGSQLFLWMKSSAASLFLFPPGHIACVYDRGRGVLPHIWGPGLHLKIPFWQVASLFNAQILEYTIVEGVDSGE